jgi:hypothetical protein
MSWGRTVEVGEPNSSANLTLGTSRAYDALGTVTPTVHGRQTRPAKQTQRSPGNRQVVLNFEPAGLGMARRSNDGRLEEALATLINSQANLVSNQASFQANFMALTARTDERFARIEAELAEIRAILLRHGEILLRHEQILQNLPEAIRQKIGFETR